MKPVFAAPKGQLDRKPPHGSPCNGCGLCCVASLCPLAQSVMQKEPIPGPCPALMYDSEDPTFFMCGLTVEPGAFSPDRTRLYGEEPMKAAARWLIGAGEGCDARFNEEPSNESFRDRLKLQDRLNSDKTKQAKFMWGML